ncbi:NVEALA domain-containing protein [Bacteroides fragilis]
MSVDSFLLFFLFLFFFHRFVTVKNKSEYEKFFFVSAFLLLVGIAVMTVCRMNNKQYLSELALVNVEALATGEGDVPTSCYGSGNVDCPISDSKVSYVMNGRSF